MAKKVNALINISGLLREFKEDGKERVSPGALDVLETALESSAGKLIRRAREEAVSHGRKTIKKEDAEQAVAMELQEKSWEI
ncbi:MAG: NFYB/HAP3 family transcription factor subunit [Nanoarchaeota archaeon]|nr:NFYB/HAP3 family transcription factor subunit [Nanoarchaeota archaeon]